MLLGLSGYAGCGKDTVGKILIDEFGFQRYAFADELKNALYALNPVVGLNTRSGRPIRLKGLIDSAPGSFDKKWDTAKKLPDVRSLLQRMGTEVGREFFGDGVWVDVVFRKIDLGADVVLTDCRFPNESYRIREAGGHMIRVHRPGVGPAKDDKGHVHLSEIALDDWTDWSAHIQNDGSVKDLAVAVTDMLESLEKANEHS